MKTFVEIKEKSFTFSSCDSCDAKCCDGARGSTFAPINLEDFETVSKNFPIAFTIGSLGYVMPVVLLSNGSDFCKYIKNFKCTIYNERPAVCKVYPLSSAITNEIFIDTSCPAVNKAGKSIVNNGSIQEEFFHEKLNANQNKTVGTYLHFSKFKKEDLEEFFTVNEMSFNRFINNVDDEYIKMHIDSQKHFDEYYMFLV